VILMLETSFIAIFALFAYRAKFENRLHALDIGDMFKLNDVWVLVLLVATCSACGITVWLLDMLETWLGGAGQGDIGTFGSSLERIESAFTQWLANITYFFKYVTPSLVAGTLVAMAVSRNSGVHWLKRGWKHILLTIAFIFLMLTVNYVLYSSISLYLLEAVSIFTNNLLLLGALKLIAAIIYFGIALPGVASAITIPFLPDRKDFIELPQEEEF
ncbi:MAG: hypothetical protein AAF570_21955, partial [Bacteroidota bacterium]